jgi:hypothetical protein
VPRLDPSAEPNRLRRDRQRRRVLHLNARTVAAQELLRRSAAESAGDDDRRRLRRAAFVLTAGDRLESQVVQHVAGDGTVIVHLDAVALLD